MLFSAGARCILEHPAEEHFYRTRTRSSLAPPVGGNPAQRVTNVYSTDETIYSALKYSATVGDALSTSLPFLIFFLRPPKYEVSFKTNSNTL
jgi:hypothetical protein